MSRPVQLHSATASSTVAYSSSRLCLGRTVTVSQYHGRSHAGPSGQRRAAQRPALLSRAHSASSSHEARGGSSGQSSSPSSSDDAASAEGRPRVFSSRRSSGTGASAPRLSRAVAPRPTRGEGGARQDSAPRSDNRLATRSLGECLTADEVLDAVAPHLPGGGSPSPASIHDVATALSQLARLASAGGPSSALHRANGSRLAALVDHLLALIQAGKAAPRYLSNSLHSCAKLRVPISQAWWDAFFAATGRSFSSTKAAAKWNSQDCSNTLWAVAVLGAAPPPEWLENFFATSAARLPEAVPQAMSNTLYAAGLLQAKPPQAWLDGFIRESLRPPPGGGADGETLLSQFSGQALGNSFHAVAVLGWTPPADWVQSFFAETAGRMPLLRAQELCNVMYAIGVLKITPPKLWLVTFFADTLRRLGTFAPQGLSIIVYALALIKVAPPDDWMRSLFAASHSVLDAVAPAASGAAGQTPASVRVGVGRNVISNVHPQFFSNLLYGLALLQVAPPPGWIRSMYAATEAHFGLFSAQELSNTAYAVADLAAEPPPPEPWLRSFWAAADAQLGGFSRQGLCNVLWAAACLGSLRDPTADRMWASAARQLAKVVREVPPGANDEVELHLRQMFQIALCSALEAGLLPAHTVSDAPLSFGGDEELSGRARVSWDKDVRRSEGLSQSSFEEMVAESLTDILGDGNAHEVNFFCEGGLRVIDIALPGGAAVDWAPGLAGRRVAIEVDGPQHWVRCFPDPAQPPAAPHLVFDGRTKLRNRILTLAGWTVVSVANFEWNSVGPDIRAKGEILRRKLQQAVVAESGVGAGVLASLGGGAAGLGAGAAWEEGGQLAAALGPVVAPKRRRPSLMGKDVSRAPPVLGQG